jgi:hypothetical protein
MYMPLHMPPPSKLYQSEVSAWRLMSEIYSK